MSHKTTVGDTAGSMVVGWKAARSEVSVGYETLLYLQRYFRCMQRRLVTSSDFQERHITTDSSSIHSHPIS
eukprot:6456369-Amphidinium_carterae.1